MWLYSGQTEPQGYGLNPCEGQFLQCFVLHYEKLILSSCVQVDVGHLLHVLPLTFSSRLPCLHQIKERNIPKNHKGNSSTKKWQLQKP